MPLRIQLICTAVMIAILSVGGLVSNGKAQRATVSEGSWYFENIDVTDTVAVLKWAKDMCAGATASDLAPGLHVEPTVSAVSEALTSDLPAEVRQQARAVCELELRGSTKGPRPAQ